MEKGKEPMEITQKDDKDLEVKATTATLTLQYDIKMECKKLGGKEAAERGKNDQ